MGLDKYDIEEEVLAAGPSTFYRARNTLLGHEVMIRRLMIDPSRADDVEVTFYREQRHAAGLAHPQIQQPIDVFEEDGYLWSVHEHHTTRSTLAMVKEDGPLPIAEVGRLGAQIADVLGFMHGRHFIHGKVQPGLVLVNEREDSQLINLVKSADIAAGIWPLRPAVLGLSTFSAPEEFRGERPTFLTDLYGLAGTIAYWLTGRWPRGGADDEEALQRAADGAPVVNLRGLRPEIPSSLVDALAAALEPDPDARHGSVGALGSILTEIFQRQAAEIPSGFQTGALLIPTGGTSSLQIVGRHGSGAFGVVLRAKGPEGETVHAVKALKPEHRDDSEARERFVRESRALQQIDDPHVVQVLGVGEEHGTPYVVMEFIAGPDLGTLLLREGMLDVPHAAKLGADIAQGLAAIHREQIVHRDLKPHNILVSDDGQKAIIADFGVAKTAQATRLTMTGNMLGTPAYMAPEQFEDEPVTPAVDLFALGSILYEMVSGGTPFPASDAFEMIRAVREREPEPLPAHVPEQLAAVIQGLLQKDPAERPADAEVVADELRALASRPG